MVCSGIFTVSCATIVFVQFVCGLGSFEEQAAWPKREQFVWVILLNLPSILSVFRDKIWSNTQKDGGTFQSGHIQDVHEEEVLKS